MTVVERIGAGVLAVMAALGGSSCEDGEFTGRWELVSSDWEEWPADGWTLTMELGKSRGEYTVSMFGSNGGGHVDVDTGTEVDVRLTLWRWVDEGSRKEDQAVLGCMLVDAGLDCVRDPGVIGNAGDFPDWVLEWRFEREG